MTDEYKCAIYDSREGRFEVTVRALNEDQADEEAMIAAAENGCRDVTDVICTKVDSL